MAVHLVETSEEDSLFAIVQHAADLLNEGQTKTALAETPGSRFQAEMTELLTSGRHTEFLLQFAAQTGILLSRSSPTDAECCLFIAMHLLPRSEQEEFPCVQRLAASIAANPGEHDEVRLSALINLFNLAQLQQSKQVVLRTVLELVQKSRPLAQTLVSQIRQHSDGLFKSLNLSGAMLRDFCLGCAGVLKVVGDRNSLREYVRLVSTALATAKAGDRAALEALQPYAVSAIQEFIRSPDAMTSDIAPLPAVAQLAAAPRFAALHKLYTTMLTGTLAEFQAVATPTLLEQVGVTPEAATTKMRFMALLAVVSGSGAEPLDFGAIQAALGLGSEEEVEVWLVRAVGKKLIEGKIDQVQCVFVPAKCTYRTFGPEEWRKLQRQLHQWQGTLASVQNTILASQLPVGPRRAAAPAAAKA